MPGGDQEAGAHQPARAGTRFISRAPIWVEPVIMPATIGRNARPVLTGRVALDHLQVVGQEEEEAEHPDHREAQREVDAAAVAVDHHAQRQQRGLDLRLDRDERGQQRTAAATNRPIVIAGLQPSDSAW